MKSDKKRLKEYISKIIREYLKEAEEKEEKPADDAAAGGEKEAAAGEEDNPFAAAGDTGEEEKESGDKKQPEAPKEVPVTFDITKAKQYNKMPFRSNTGVVKSIDKKGIVVTTKPDNVDVLINFSDIEENTSKLSSITKKILKENRKK